MSYLKPDQLLKVLGHARNEGSRELCMFLFGYAHALRASEIAALTVEDVRNGRIRCKRGKGSDHTTEELREHSNELLNEKLALAAWLRERGDGDGSCFLFTSRKGSRLTRQQVYRLFRRCLELAGITDLEHMGSHQLKHAYASHLLRAGADLAFVQKCLGHAHVSSTVRYTHVSVSEGQAVSNRILASVFA
jgi:site-specific recombinase XerD